MKRWWLVFMGLVLATSVLAQTKVVYHLVDGIPQAARAIGNIHNHLGADPTARIVVVGHGAGIDFMLEGAQTPTNQSFADAIADLSAKGVEFRICNNTLTNQRIAKEKVVMEAKVVPSGVVEVANLQAQQGFVYLRP